MSNLSKRRGVVLGIIALIAAIHIFRVGSVLPEAWFNFYYGYFSDIILPFGGYFLLCAAEQNWPFLRSWKVKLAVAFLIPAIDETFQYFGLHVLGTTFDLLDYGMYAMGAALAVVFDTQIFSRLFHFWSLEKPEK